MVSQISHYRIIEKLGAGGMGEVWLAEDKRLDRKVAIKLLPAEFTRDADRVRRFMQEAKAASALNHPNIITVYDIGESEAGRFIVMELVAGRTLRTVIARDNSLETSIALGGQMAKALSAAHGAGITHRDIKPDNIMVRDDGYVKVLDFGLARLLPTESDEDAATIAQQTTPGMIMGTVAYMSPEQASGQSATPLSDIFSLGIVLYELMTGRHPFKADTLVGYLHAITLQTPLMPSQLRRWVPVALDDLILRMLRKDAGQRPTATDVAQALQDIERHGDTLKLRPVESETILLPTAVAEATSADEGFWVAVLPFKSRGANADLEALADGLTEDIVTGLSRFSYLRVIARSTTLRYVSNSVDARSIGKEVGARYVMEGNLRYAGSMLRLAVQLVDATTGTTLWAETYDRPYSPEQIFVMQDDLVPRIVSTCGDHFGVLSRSISEAVRWKDSGRLNPYEALMRGFGYHHRLTPSEHAEARDVLERAVEQAPGNADCWAMLSWIYSHEYAHGFNTKPGSLDRALAGARRAVDLAPSNHLAYQTLAVALFFSKDTAGCLSAAERAIALNPLDASNEAIFLITFMGDWERGCSLISRAMDLNPHHPGWYHWVLALNEYRKANYREAVDRAVKANASEVFWTNMLLAAAYGQLGELDAARDALRSLLAQKEDFVEWARRTLAIWFQAELVEHLTAGLRKAGLEVDASLVSSGGLRADEGFWVAVLPFKYRGANDDLVTLAEALSEDIVTGLSRFSYLRIIARSTLRYNFESGDVRELGKALGARYVIEGSLRQAGSVLRIAVQLVDTSTGAHLWAETYNRTFSPEAVFELQDDLVPRIVSTVADWYGVLPHSMSEAVRLKASDQLSPYEAVLRSFGYFERITPEEHAVVRPGLERAVVLAPGNADGWAMLSMIYGEEHRFGFNAQPDPLGRSLHAARQAVDAAHGNNFAWLALAQALFFRKEFEAFRDAAERAIALNPMDGSTIEYMSHLIAFSGDWRRGCELAERARQLNPNHPAWYWAVPFLDAYRKGDYRNARTFLLKGNQQGHFFLQALIAAVQGQLGEREAAEKALQQALTLKPDFPLTAREDFEKWYLPELVDQVMDGLRKAGLEIVGTEQAASAELSTEFSKTDVSQLEMQREQPSIRHTTSPTQSLAVLPFANISAEEENEYFCDGLAEELLNALAKIDDLKVAARTSAFSFKGKNAEAREIGRTLNVNTVLEGSVRKSGTRVRITVQLVNAADGYQLWSERYDREMRDIFDVQDEITVAVVDALKLKLFGKEKAGIFGHKPNSPEALDFYLKGRFHFQQHSPEGFKKAIEYFQKAIDEDSNYALAYAGLSSVLIFRWFFGFVSADEVIPKAKNAALRALEINANLDEAHIALANIWMFYEWNLEKAEQEHHEAIRLNPKNAYGRYQYGLCLAVMEKPQQAIFEAEKAIELEPLSILANFQVTAIYFQLGLFEESSRYAQMLTEMAPDFYGGYLLLGAVRLAQGEFVEAIRILEKSLTLDNEQNITKSFLGQAFGLTGNKTRALELIKELQDERENQYVTAFHIARIYSSIRDLEKTFKWLEQACQERDGELVYLKSYSRFGCGNIWGQEFRSDLRFQDLLHRLGLPNYETNQADQSPGAQTAMPAPITGDNQGAKTRAAPATLLHTVGRERELNELRAAFTATKDRRGSLLCVAGEPGIGKTTLVEDFLAELADEPQCAIARGRCSERLAGTEAYLPLLDALENLLQSDQSISTTMKQVAPTWYAQLVPLSGESDESARLLADVKAASQERMKRELASFLQAVAESHPLVLFFDDLHWADVSTIDVLSFLAGKFGSMRALIVTTYRPSDMLLTKHPFLQIKPDLQARGVCRELLLEFLNEPEIAEYLALEFPDHGFPAEFTKLIHTKTEGSPLFMADVVRYLRDRGVIASEESRQDACAPRYAPRWMLAQALPDIERELPESVRGMIERKIGQLSDEDHKLLTAASVQGYEFDSAVLSRVLNLGADEVEERLEKLERVYGFVKLLRESEFPNQILTLRYRFVHVLYQNALLTALRATRKATLSREVAKTLEDFHGERKSSIANELAALYEAGREFAKAGEYFQLAAEHAREVFADREAATLASRGIEALKSLPETSERDQQELALQVILGLALRTIRGYSNDETGRAYARASELCRQIGDAPQLFPVLFGLWEFYQSTGQLETAIELVEQLLTSAGQDPSLLLVAHNVSGDHLTWLGRFVAAREHLEKGIALYDSDGHRSNVSQFGYDSGVACLGFASIVLWHLGYPDQALKRADEACDLAAKLSHPLNSAYAASFAAWFYSLIGSMQSAGEHADRAIAISDQFDIAMFLAWGRLMKGWSLVGQSKIEEGMSLATQGAGEWRATGTLLATSWCLGILAEGNLKAGRTEESQELLSQALDHASMTGEHFYEAELYRLRGELMLKLPAQHTRTDAEASFYQAIDVASRQQAKSLELRAALSLARLWNEDGKHEEARAMLSGIYGWFTEGFDTADLKDAKALLDELQQHLDSIRTVKP